MRKMQFSSETLCAFWGQRLNSVSKIIWSLPIGTLLNPEIHGHFNLYNKSNFSDATEVKDIDVRR